jgi:hypothetical protein
MKIMNNALIPKNGLVNFNLFYRKESVIDDKLLTSQETHKKV